MALEILNPQVSSISKNQVTRKIYKYHLTPVGGAYRMHLENLLKINFLAFLVSASLGCSPEDQVTFRRRQEKMDPDKINATDKT